MNDEPGCVRVAWEGDFEALHSLAIVNRAVCRGLIDRGDDVRLIDPSDGAGRRDASLTRALPTAYRLLSRMR